MEKQIHDYISVYKKDPFTVNLNLDNLKNGSYYIEGEVTEEKWFKACKQIDVPNAGSCKAKCTVEKKGNVLKLFGEIEVEMLRTCVRTLKEFLDKEKLTFNEDIFISETDNEELNEVLTGSNFSVAEYLTQQIILNMNPYPVHPDTLSAKSGAFDVEDGQEKAIKQEKEEKNPFSVLKNLKSNS